MSVWNFRFASPLVVSEHSPKTTARLTFFSLPATSTGS